MIGCVTVFWLAFFSSCRDLGLQAQLDEEASDYEDILQDMFFDSYNNLTIKTLYILRHFVHSDHDYLLKTDDDSYIGIRE